MQEQEIAPTPRLSAGVVVVRSSSSGFEFLFLRAYEHWDFPKGIVEPGETPLNGAIREVQEETTIVDLNFDWGKNYIETGPYNRGKVARYYLAQTQQQTVDLPINPELGKPEHVEYRWTDYPTGLTLTTARVRPVLTWAANILKID